ncbi:MAG: hypothetical protein QNI99_02315 [Woeseiaceae bacterium]|nr:hypothetical protein [Woeseiaceae bacterium]
MKKPGIEDLLVRCVLEPELLQQLRKSPESIFDDFDLSERAREILSSPDARLLELLGEAVGGERGQRVDETTEPSESDEVEPGDAPPHNPEVRTLPQSRLALRLVPYAQQATDPTGDAQQVIVNYAGHLDPLPEGAGLHDLQEVPQAVTDGQQLPPVSVVVSVQPAVWTDQAGNQQITFSVSAQLPQDAVEQSSGDVSDVSLSPWRHDVDSPAVKAAADSVQAAEQSDRYQRLRELIDVMVTPAPTAGDVR